ncbi:TRAP transporter small permease [Desulfocurvus sp. DL9XJH121]
MRRIRLLLHFASLGLNTACEAILALCGAGMAVVIGLQVIFRYALNDSLFWSEELGRLLLVWLTFCGAAVAYRRGAHIGVDALVARLSAKAARSARILAQAVCLAFFAAMAVGGWQLMELLGFQTMAAMGFSKQVPFVMVPAGFTVLCVHALSMLLDELAGERP